MRTMQSLARRIAALELNAQHIERPIPMTLDTLTYFLSPAERLSADITPERREAIRQECENLRRGFHEGTVPRFQKEFLNVLPLEVILTLADESTAEDATDPIDE